MRIHSLVKKMIFTPLHNPDEVLPNESGWQDAINQGKTLPDKRIYEAPIGDKRNDYIRRRLGHIIVNPHNEDSTEALKKVYVYASEISRDYDKIDDIYINKSETNTDKFIQHLISQSHKARQQLVYVEHADPTDLRDNAARGCHIIVHGKKGCGKTFFLNHLLAKYSKKLDDENVLWVRLNLVEDFGSALVSDFKFDLAHRIYAQTTKIVFRYYDPMSDYYKYKPKPLSLMKDLRNFVREKYDKEDQIHRMDGLVAMQHAFGTEGFDPQIRPDLIPLPIGQALFHQVLRKGYSIICVLDGLDQLESSTHHRRRFMQLFDSAINLTNSQGNLGIAIVSVTRTNTYNSFPDITLKPNQYISGETIVKQILPIDFNAIVQRRIEFLRDNVPMLAKGGTGWSLNDWPSHLDKFLEFLKSSQQDAHIENPMYAFGDNRRAQMQVVQLQYFDFLRQEGTQSYLFLESLVLAGQRFPPRNYRHTLTSKGNWRSEFIGTTAFDNHLLPSVFTFPYIEFESLGGHPHQIPNSEGVLLGIRVLQILAANESLVKDLLSNRSHITAKAMSDILFTLFSYPRELTMTLINQFAENEFLGLGGLDFPLYLEPTRQCLYMMPKSVYTLRQFLYDIAYLNLCTMRVPLAFRKDKRTPNFFIQACLDEAINPTINWDLNVSESLVQWAAAKIINSCSMFRLLSRINKVQKQRYRNQLQFLDQQQKQIAMHAERGQEGIFDGMFKFPEKMHIQLLQQIDAMVRSIEEDDPRATEVILRLVEDYWSYWGTK